MTDISLYRLSASATLSGLIFSWNSTIPSRTPTRDLTSNCWSISGLFSSDKDFLLFWKAIIVEHSKLSFEGERRPLLAQYFKMINSHRICSPALRYYPVLWINVFNIAPVTVWSIEAPLLIETKIILTSCYQCMICSYEFQRSPSHETAAARTHRIEYTTPAYRLMLMRWKWSTLRRSDDYGSCDRIYQIRY